MTPQEQTFLEIRLCIKHQYSELMALMCVDVPLHQALMEQSLKTIGLLCEANRK